MTARGLWVAGASGLLLATVAVAQTVYTWKDDKGVVHFSDENPEGIKNVEKLQLEAPAPLVTEGGQEGAPGEGTGDGSTMVVTPAAGQPQGGGAPPQAQAQPQPPAGPAEVVFLGADLSPLNATQRAVRGKVRNAGGGPALKVAVRVVIADGDSGNLCMTGEMNVTPRDLGAGETGAFEGTLDTPCFYGNPTINYYPEWD
jgi:hypothetical protein